MFCEVSPVLSTLTHSGLLAFNMQVQIARRGEGRFIELATQREAYSYPDLSLHGRGRSEYQNMLMDTLLMRQERRR